jgi:thiamine-phosphate pyrophosphorylase
MPLNLQKPISYLITSGATTATTAPATKEFSQILKLVEAAVRADISLVQLREKDLSDGVLYELAVSSAAITQASNTRLLINDRADIAEAAGADGVHLTARSLEPSVVRRAFGTEFLIGASTHSLDQAQAAHRGGADFAVFGPVFDTMSKKTYGPPLGLQTLNRVCTELAPFPILAIGGITLDNAADCVRLGASGVAAIRMFSNGEALVRVIESLRAQSAEQR